EEADWGNPDLTMICCRPSPAYVLRRLREKGFRHFYSPGQAPGHQDFAFTYKGEGGYERAGRPLRQILIASRAKLDSPSLRQLERAEYLFDNGLERLPCWLLRLLVFFRYRPQRLTPAAGGYLGVDELP